MKRSHILGIIIAAVLIIFSAVYPVPEKYVYVSSSSKAYDYSWSKNKGAEYLGGDAYNYQVEASLKAGYLTGVVAMKSLTFVGGLLLLFLTLYSHNKFSAIEEQNQLLFKLAENSVTNGKNLEKIFEAATSQNNLLSDVANALLPPVASAEENTNEEC